MNNPRVADRKEVKKFALYLGGFLLLLGFVRMMLGRGGSSYLYCTGFIVLLIGFSYPMALRPVFIVFRQVGLLLGKINTTIVLTLFFYIIITPISLVRKVMKKTTLDLSFRKNVTSYWGSVDNNAFSKKHFKDQF